MGVKRCALIERQPFHIFGNIFAQNLIHQPSKTTHACGFPKEGGGEHSIYSATLLVRVCVCFDCFLTNFSQYGNTTIFGGLYLRLAQR